MKKLIYIKIAIAIFLSFIIVRIGSQAVFIANTPYIRPDLNQYAAFNFSRFIGGGAALYTLIFDRNKLNIKDELKDVPLNTLAKGVYAKDKKNISYILIKDNEVEWIEYKFQLKGKEMIIKVPKGDKPPSQELLEKLY